MCVIESLKAGYFVVRGVPFNYGGFDITDLDLWLYNRVSSVSREISIVDIKNKKTPQAIERIFWTKGLQEALGVSGAIVVTTENREEVKAFGKQMDVLVLDGKFQQRLSSAAPSSDSRITDEELKALLVEGEIGKLAGDWASRMRDAKAFISNGLSFDTCNYWIAGAHYFAEQLMSRPKRSSVCLRCFYILISYAAVTIDFVLRDLSFLDESEREARLRDGFLYGARGKTGTKGLIDTAVGLVEQFTDRGTSAASQLRFRVEARMAQLPANVLSQFFARVDTGKSLFDVAKELETIGMAKLMRGHTEASIGVRSLIGCLLDFWSIDRRAFSLEATPPDQLDLMPPEADTGNHESRGVAKQAVAASGQTNPVLK